MALARQSSHPLARALTDAARGKVTPSQAQDVRVTLAAGIAGTVEGRALRLGHARFALAEGRIDPILADDALILADDEGPLARFRFHEQPRPDAPATLEQLRREGVGLRVASGDRADRVAALAARLDIDDWHAGQLPADKLALLRSLQADGHTVLAVGDGSNDAPLLAAADVSAALTSGTNLAQAQADLLLLDGRLDGLLQARAMALRMREVVGQSRRWALLYNLFAVPFAAVGLVPPWLAAIGMSLSSLLVVLNALRVGRDRSDDATPGRSGSGSAATVSA